MSVKEADWALQTTRASLECILCHHKASVTPIPRDQQFCNKCGGPMIIKHASVITGAQPNEGGEGWV